MRMHFAVTMTIGGGVPRAFISTMCPFFMQSIAFFAFSRAGIADDSAFSAVSFKCPASLAAILVFSSSSDAPYYSTSATADSSPTF